MTEITVKGKYNTAKIFTNIIEHNALGDILNLCNQEFVKDSKIRIMPDVHSGIGCTIGTTMTIKDKVVPNLVGVDIGCGMITYKLKEKDINLEELDKFIRTKIPSGINIRKNSIHRYIDNIKLKEIKCFKNLDFKRITHSMGTLGGGNHFIEIDRDDDGYLYLVIHSGSRYLGKQVAEYYQKMACEQIQNNLFDKRNKIIEQLKKEKKYSEIQDITKQIKNNVPKDLSYLEGELFDDYINDMKITQEYATYNRKAMADDIVEHFKFHIEDNFTTIHNYIDINNMILRKGAVSAKKDERLLIPINMRDGSLICLGKGNEDWNYSAPHGAGRLYSRSKAKETFTLNQFKETMSGIYTTSVNESTLDESPMVYKNMEDIINNIGDTVEIKEIIKPIYNFKAS